MTSGVSRAHKHNGFSTFLHVDPAKTEFVNEATGPSTFLFISFDDTLERYRQRSHHVTKFPR